MAGVSSKEIKNRIRSMKSTRQITKAMEMVASSKLRKAQINVQNARPYFETLLDAISHIAGSGRGVESPYLQPGKSQKKAFVVIGGDRGLAGGYKSTLFKGSLAEMEGADVAVLPIGKKALEFFKSKGYEVLTEAYGQAEEVSVGDCFSIANLLCKKYLAGELGEICVAYTKFQSVLSQVPDTLQALPLQPGKSRGETREILYEPDAETVLSRIVPEYVGGVLYGALCESRVSEQAARRTAMDAATQNADEMIADLNLKYNQARQAAITQEITEIIAGA